MSLDLDLLLQSPWLWAAGALVVLLIGLCLGAAAGIRQERDRIEQEQEREARTSYSLTMGLSSVIAGNPELAIRELRRVAEADTEAIEIVVLLGDLLRERGRVEQAIRLHKAVLKRPGLEEKRKTVALAGLAKDFARAGFVDRALRTYREVAEREPESLTAWHHIERLHEETRDWKEALAAQQRILQLRGSKEDDKVQGFLLWKVGEAQLREGQRRKALREWARAVQVWPKTTPAWLATGDLYHRDGEAKRAEEAWLAAADNDPERAHLALERLDELWRQSDEPDRAEDLAEEWMERRPQDWHLPLLLARRAHLQGNIPEALRRLRQTLERNPRSLQALGLAWKLAVPDEASSSSTLVELGHLLEAADAFAELHLCLHCRYITTELLWRCPHCHTWDPFVTA